MSEMTLTTGLAQRLSHYCSAYRLTLLRRHLPSRERNQCLRAAQRIQSRLYHCSDQEACALPLCWRETLVLQTVIVGLLQQQPLAAPGEQRNTLVAELADTLLLVRRSLNPARHP